jgi:hypothetical protein
MVQGILSVISFIGANKTQLFVVSRSVVDLYLKHESVDSPIGDGESI